MNSISGIDNHSAAIQFGARRRFGARRHPKPKIIPMPTIIEEPETGDDDNIPKNKSHYPFSMLDSLKGDTIWVDRHQESTGNIAGGLSSSEPAQRRSVDDTTDTIASPLLALTRRKEGIHSTQTPELILWLQSIDLLALFGEPGLSSPPPEQAQRRSVDDTGDTIAPLPPVHTKQQDINPYNSSAISAISSPRSFDKTPDRVAQAWNIRKISRPPMRPAGLMPRSETLNAFKNSANPFLSPAHPQHNAPQNTRPNSPDSQPEPNQQNQPN